MMAAPPPTTAHDGDFSSALAPVSALRVLMLGWCLWLLGSWGVATMLDGPRLGGRWLVMSVMVGLMLVWPTMRLSQPRWAGRSALGQALGEWLCLMLVVQAVLWPLRLTTGWTIPQTAWLDGGLAAWSGITAVLIAWGRRGDTGGARGGAMGLCVALVLAEPLVLELLRYTGVRAWTLRISPIQALWSLTALRAPVAVEPWHVPILAAALAAASGAGVVWVLGGKEPSDRGAKRSKQ